jgi:hypothetical protein
MQALLGPSGAGKSTLMDILALRKSVGSISGRLLVNGQPASKAFIRKTAYVPQVEGQCAVCCVLCAVCCVLCAVCCVQWAVCCVLCAVCCVLCAVGCVLCAVGCVLCKATASPGSMPVLLCCRVRLELACRMRANMHACWVPVALHLTPQPAPPPPRHPTPAATPPLQADNFVPTMTTEETLAFFAALILPAHMGSADKAARVKEVLAALGLSHTAHTLVGAAAAACWSACRQGCMGAWLMQLCA